MAESLSVTTFVVGDRLPWPDDPSSVAEQGPLDMGILHDSGVRQECAIHKISALGATLRGQLQKLPGDDVSIELGTGQRAGGKIAWVRDGEAGICFNQPVDVLALINRKLVSQPVERRAMPRVELRCSIYVKWGATISPAFLRNISATGLQLEGDELPKPGTFISVFFEGLNVPPGEVIWRKGDLAGVRLLEELSWTSIMPWIRQALRKGAN
ncbi:MAG: PilZ domain-containing protein [Sphingomonas sp.]